MYCNLAMLRWHDLLQLLRYGGESEKRGGHHQSRVVMVVLVTGGKNKHEKFSKLGYPNIVFISSYVMTLIIIQWL